jgi:hypothetical protein
MIPPIFPVVWALSRLRRGRAGGLEASSAEVPTALAIWMGALLIFGIFAAAEAPLWAVPLGVFLFPWAIARSVFIPLGWPRPARFFARFSYVRLGGSQKTGALFAAAFALSRARRHDEAMARQLMPVQMRQDGCSCAAMALIAASRGDRDGARLLFRCALDFHVDQTPPAVVRCCIDWLAADAWDRGDVAFLAELGGVILPWHVRFKRRWLRLGPKFPEPWIWTFQPLTPAARFLVALARKERPFLLWLRLVRAMRPSLLPLLRHALRSQPQPETAEPAGDALDKAVALHVEAARNPLSPRLLARVCSAWQAALDDGQVGLRLLERELELGVREGSDPTGRLGRAAVQDLAEQAAEAEPGAGGDWFSQDVFHSRRDTALSTLETLAEARRVRIGQQQLPGELEVSEFATYREAYERAGRLGSEPRRMAYGISRVVIWNGGAWLANGCEQRPLAHALFRWLWREADATSDEATVKDLRRNVEVTF